MCPVPPPCRPLPQSGWHSRNNRDPVLPGTSAPPPDWCRGDHRTCARFHGLAGIFHRQHRAAQTSSSASAAQCAEWPPRSRRAEGFHCDPNRPSRPARALRPLCRYNFHHRQNTGTAYFHIKFSVLSIFSGSFPSLPLRFFRARQNAISGRQAPRCRSHAWMAPTALAPQDGSFQRRPPPQR